MKFIEKVCNHLSNRKNNLEKDMIQYQDQIEVMRDQDFNTFEQMKQSLKMLKEDSVKKDYQIIRMAKQHTINQRRFKREICDMEINIDGIKNCEKSKRDEIVQAK